MAKILGHDIVIASELEEAQKANAEVVTTLKEVVETQQSLIDQYVKLTTQLKRRVYTSLVVLAGTNLVALALAISK